MTPSKTTSVEGLSEEPQNERSANSVLSLLFRTFALSSSSSSPSPSSSHLCPLGRLLLPCISTASEILSSVWLLRASPLAASTIPPGTGQIRTPAISVTLPFHSICSFKKGSNALPCSSSSITDPLLQPHQLVNQNSLCDPCLTHCCLHCQEHREMQGRLSDNAVMPAMKGLGV